MDVRGYEDLERVVVVPGQPVEETGAGDEYRTGCAEKSVKP